MDNDQGVLDYYVRAYAPISPILLIWIIGVVWAIRRWRRHPKVSALYLTGFFLFLVAHHVNMHIDRLLPRPQWTDFDEWEQFREANIRWQLHLKIVDYLCIAVNTFGWSLILLAMFGWRADPAATLTPGDGAHPPKLPSEV